MDGRVAVGSSACVVRDGGNNPGGLARAKGTIGTASALLSVSSVRSDL